MRAARLCPARRWRGERVLFDTVPPSPVWKGSCPSEIRYGALVERHLIGRGRVKFYGYRCALRSTGPVSSIFDKLGLLCLYRVQRHFGTDEMPYNLTVNAQHPRVAAAPSTPLPSL